MDGFTNLTSIIDNALKQTAEDSGMLLGQELTIGEATSSPRTGPPTSATWTRSVSWRR